MSKDSERTFADTWKRMFPDIEIVQQFRPIKAIWEKTDKKLKFTEWKKVNKYNDFRVDMYFPEYRLCLEINGDGPGHKGKGALRDMRKANLLLELGLAVYWFSAFEVDDHASIICKRIYRHMKGIKRHVFG